MIIKRNLVIETPGILSDCKKTFKTGNYNVNTVLTSNDGMDIVIKWKGIKPASLPDNKVLNKQELLEQLLDNNWESEYTE
jgi:hypothetical protein